VSGDADRAVVVGGGFFGASVAVHLARAPHRRRVVLLEREPALMRRASLANQARVHGGYHYPRSFRTAFRSRANASRFVRDHAEAIVEPATSVYAIARLGSKVTAGQFHAFCRRIDAPVAKAPPAVAALFDARLVEDVFVVDEPAFDATILARTMARRLDEAGVEVIVGADVADVRPGDGLEVTYRHAGGDVRRRSAPLVLDCTYGRSRLGAPAPEAFKHELAEMALVALPPPLDRMAVTVMDGPFFSFVPFPSRGLHTLSHVRYTPHRSWDAGGRDAPGPPAGDSRHERMLRDAARYVPALAGARYVDSIYEVKTLMLSHEDDDGRPIAFGRDAARPGLYTIVGGKIDNVYDALARLDAELLGAPAAAGAR
jgi:glycine/D-amino acid oxidase-like deaminating enzyme